MLGKNNDTITKFYILRFETFTSRYQVIKMNYLENGLTTWVL